MNEILFSLGEMPVRIGAALIAFGALALLLLVAIVVVIAIATPAAISRAARMNTRGPASSPRSGGACTSHCARHGKDRPVTGVILGSLPARRVV